MSAAGRRAVALGRRALFLYLFFLIVNVQAVFLVMLLPGVDFDGPPMQWLNLAVIPVGLMLWRLWAERHHPDPGPEPWHAGWVLGLAMFAFWSLSYLLIGSLVRPERVTQLRFAIDHAIPFVPTFVFLYVCVYPFFLLPFLLDAPPGTHRRLALGYLVVLLVAYGFFLTVPVGFARTALPPDAKRYAIFALGKVHGLDPPWNCLPSTHCACSLLTGLALWEIDRKIGAWGLATAIGIALSTTLTKQHYVVDVVAGHALALVAYFTLLRREEQAVALLRPVLELARRVRSD